MNEPKDLSWVSNGRRCSVSARKIVHSAEYELLTGIGEDEMRIIQLWCEQNQCGRRVSFDTFQFRNKKDLAFFLLKWSS
jgi:hypothetical protein